MGAKIDSKRNIFSKAQQRTTPRHPSNPTYKIPNEENTREPL
jgi:hypothetical protein